MKSATGAITITDLNDGLNYDIELSAPVIYKDSVNAATSGVYTSITATGKQILGSDKTTFGFLTSSMNGGAESTPVANKITISPTTTSKASVYRINLYRNANKTGGVLATVDVPVVFKGAVGSPGTPAKVITLSPSALVFKVPETGATTPSTITVVGSAQGTSISSWSYSTNGGTYSTTRPAGVTISGSTVTVTASTMTANSISIKASDGTVDDVVTISKVADGATGAPAKILDLSATAEVMSFNPDSTPTSPQTVSFTANLENLTGTATFTATPYNASGTALTAITLGGTGNTRTLTSAQWPSTAVRVVVKATLSGYSDTVSVIQIKDGVKGADPIVGFLTNESVTLTASPTGVVSNFSTATGTFEVYEGLVRKTGAAPTYTRTAQVGCTAAITSSGVYSVSAMTADIATATFTATLNGVTLTKTLSLAKSREGVKGDTGSKGDNGLSVMLLNENQTISTTSSRAASPAQIIEIPFTAYLGSDRIAATASYGTLPSGVTLSSNTAGTTSSPGLLKFNVASGANFGGTTTAFDSGRIDITITANGVQTTKSFNWSKAVAGATARTFFVEPNVSVIVKSETGSYTPTSLVFYSYYKDGTNSAKTAYARYWKIETTVNGETWTQLATQTTTSTTYTVSTIPSGISGIRATTYSNSALTSVHDTQSVMVVSDGAKGDDGIPSYTWIKYADDVQGNGMTDTPEGKRFMGMAFNKITPTESSNKADYQWTSLYDDKIADELRSYVQSRGENLITNGTGLLGNNTNFSDATFDGSQVFIGGGSFTRTGRNGSIRIDELIPYDITKEYKLSFYTKTLNGKGTFLPRLNFYDVDRQAISRFHIRVASFPETELAKELKVGDTKIYLKSVEGFRNDDVAAHLRIIQFWGYKNSFGYEYSNYTRNSYQNIWSPGGIDPEEKTITLDRPFAHPNPNSPDGVWPAGQKVSSGTGGDSYSFSVSYTQQTTEWQKYEQIYKEGVNTTVGGPLNDAIAFVQIVILTERSLETTETETTWINGVEFTDTTLSKTFTWVKYADSITGAGISSSSTGKDYIGLALNKPNENATDNPRDYTWSLFRGPQGVQGPQGAKGATGERGPQGPTGTSVSSITENYLATSAGTGVTTGTSGWSTSVQTMTLTNKYLWNYEKITFSDGSTSNTIPVIIGVHGATGATGGTGPSGSDGRSITGITENYLATASASGVTRSTSGWSTAMQPTTDVKKYLWNYETITWSKAPLTTYVEPIIIGVHGDTGATGAPGADGKDALSVMLLNENQSLSATSSRTISPAQTIEIPFVAYLGTSRIPATASYGALPAGVTLKSNTPATASSDGLLSFNVANAANLGGTTTAFDRGKIDITIAANGTSVVRPFNWTKTVAGSNGRVYYVEPDIATIKKDKDGNYTPSAVTFTSTYKDGTGATKTARTAYWKIETTINGSTWIQHSTHTGSLVSTLTVNVPNNIVALRATTYSSTALTVATSYDTQTVMIVSDGATGAQGPQGPKGATGAQGKGISSTLVQYKASSSGTTTPTGTWSNTVPAVTDNQYLWTRTTITYTDNEVTNAYSVGKMGAQGPQGTTGSTGNGIASTSVTYQSSSSGTVTPTGSWSATVPSVADNQYLWTRVITSYTNGDSATSYSIGKMGAQGPQGAKGETGARGATGSQGPKGDTGVSVSSIVEKYLATSASSGVTTATSGWSETMQTMTASKKYLWNYEIINFSDGSSSPTIPVIMGIYGDKGETGSTGRSITGIKEHYLASSSASGITRSSSGWSETMQQTTPTKKYLWNYETVTWSSGTITTYVEPIIIGIHGDKGDKGDKGDTGAKGATGEQGPRGAQGTSVDSIVENYLATSSGTGVTTGTSGWTTTVQSISASKKYLWNYEKINFSDGTSQNTVPVIIGVYGDTGPQGSTGGTGPKGEEGRSITGITEHYLASASATGVTRSTGGWSTTMQPTSDSKRYLWNYETITWSKAPLITYIEPIVIGVHGAKGDQGETGPAGPNKITKNTLFENDWLVASHIQSLNGLTIGDQFSVDDEGNVTFGGTLSGADGTFSGRLQIGEIATGLITAMDGVFYSEFRGVETPGEEKFASLSFNSGTLAFGRTDKVISTGQSFGIETIFNQTKEALELDGNLNVTGALAVNQVLRLNQSEIWMNPSNDIYIGESPLGASKKLIVERPLDAIDLSVSGGFSVGTTKFINQSTTAFRLQTGSTSARYIEFNTQSSVTYADINTGNTNFRFLKPVLSNDLRITTTASGTATSGGKISATATSLQLQGNAASTTNAYLEVKSNSSDVSLSTNKTEIAFASKVSSNVETVVKGRFEFAVEPITSATESGYCGLQTESGTTANSTGIGYAVNFRTTRTTVPSTVTIARASGNITNANVYIGYITNEGFWFQFTRANLVGTNTAWRGRYTVV